MNINKQTNYSCNYIKNCNKNKIEIDHNFIQWINSVETQVLETLGYCLLDLPDESYFENFENKKSPNDMADYVIKENCYLVMNNVNPLYH